jgi:DNA-binding transcriptional LysR family regulator
MDFKKLQYFLTIAEEGQITKAAQRLHMTQPPLSHQLKVFEEELGVKLIERDSRKIQLTELGRALQERGGQILELINKTEKELKELSEGLQGTLSIGTVAAWGATLLPDRISSLHRQYPGINFQLWEGDGHRIRELLDTGVIDIGIVRMPFDSRRYETILLPEEPLIAAISSIWGYDSSKEYTTLMELVNIPLILHRRNEVVIEYYQQQGLQPRILCRHEDVRSMLVWADAGLGAAIATRSAASLVPNHNLQYKEIVDPPLKVTASVIWKRDRPLSVAAKHFLETFTV